METIDDKGDKIYLWMTGCNLWRRIGAGSKRFADHTTLGLGMV